MAEQKLKKLSKSVPTPASFEIIPVRGLSGNPYEQNSSNVYAAAEDNDKWLWACDQGCFDNTPYDSTTKSGAKQAAQNHLDRVHKNK